MPKRENDVNVVATEVAPKKIKRRSKKEVSQLTIKELRELVHKEVKNKYGSVRNMMKEFPDFADTLPSGWRNTMWANSTSVSSRTLDKFTEKLGIGKVKKVTITTRTTVYEIH